VGGADQGRLGQTETAVQVANTPGQLVKSGSMGRPTPGYTVTLIDPASGVPGNEVRSASTQRAPGRLMTGYAGAPGITEEAMAAATTALATCAGSRRLHHLHRSFR